MTKLTTCPRVVCAAAFVLILAGCASQQTKWVDISGQNRSTDEFQMADASCSQQATAAVQNIDQEEANNNCNTPTCIMAKELFEFDTFNTNRNTCLLAMGWKKIQVQSTETNDTANHATEGSTPNAVAVIPASSNADGNDTAKGFDQVLVMTDGAAYVDRFSIKTIGDKKNVDVLINYYEPSGPKAGFFMRNYLSAKLFMSFNCKNATYSFTHEKDYTNYNFQGDEVNDRHIFFQSNKRIVRGQLNYAVWHNVCNG